MTSPTTASPTPAPLPVPDDADPDALLDTFAGWAEQRGTPLYPHQEEALLALLGGDHVVLSTPTGSGKSLVATGAIHAALARDEVAFYTAPIKALVSEKVFDLCATFGAQNVGMLTGDAAVNADAPVIVCTAEVLANTALREGSDADVGLVVMDEFHYYAEPERGWAWQVPLLELPQAQMLLMSATLGDTTAIEEDLAARSGREVTRVADAERPVPLHFSYVLTPLQETIEELLEWRRAPIYVVHQTQAGATEHAQSLRTTRLLTKDEQTAIAARIGSFRFAAGFGRTLSALLRRGIAVHHAGMLPRYRRLVEQLAQEGLLKIICGTDTLGVGINVPIRTVLFTALTKFDGSRHRVLRVREFLQVAGRAGRAGYDTEGYVVVQAPEHVIDNERALAKAGEDPKKRRKVQRKKAPDGFVVWTEDTFTKLTTSTPETLRSRMTVTNAMILDVVARPGDPVAGLSRLTRDNHEEPAAQARLARRAIRLGRSLLDSGVLVRRDPPDPATGRGVDLTLDLPKDFALNQPLADFALAALDLLDPESPEHALDVVSVVESVLETPYPVVLAQQHAARGEAIAEMKAEGIEYEERMERLEEVTWPRPLAELLEAAYETYRQSHPWLAEDALVPKSVVRHMWEDGMSFGDLVRRYGLAPREGLVLRYLSDAYRTLQRTVPQEHRSPALEEITDWLGETVRQTDSSLVDEWEALAEGEAGREDGGEVAAAVSHHDGAPTPRPLTARTAAFRAMVRGALWQRVALAARDDVDGLARLEAAAADLAHDERRPVLTADDWDAPLAGYWDEHDEIGTDGDARGPACFHVEEAHGPPPGADERRDLADVRLWRVRQTLLDPAGDRDWVIEAEVDLEASDRVGEAVVLATAMRRL
ncbi:DEAD/DEAH box helicase [Janibacter alkaliphilus]|uniref:Superfamily II RNA helicase n=1 Tax=Janibacter alkaliphilus TaxID=1069963 RepID=A0A852XJG9_9MICO|nr:DEAD/DEAH box helicase [Janibacter alkaliphilus]NYG38471.1 superfamily II RNA helicase [Janibacter alkaliphilus]